MTEQLENNEIVIDLREVLFVLLRRAWIIILAAIVGGTLGFTYSQQTYVPTYSANCLLYVNMSSANISIGSASYMLSSSDFNLAKQLVDTYMVIMESRSFRQRVLEQLDEKYDIRDIGESITASSVSNTPIFSVTVTSHDPRQAAIVANVIADTLPDHLSTIINGSDVRVIDYAKVPEEGSDLDGADDEDLVETGEPESDNIVTSRFGISVHHLRRCAIGAFLGAVLAAAIVLLIYFLDDRVRSEDYLARVFPDIPLLAAVPDMKNERR